MRMWTVERKIIACFAATFFMIAILSAVAIHSLSSMNDVFDQAVNSTARKVWLAGDINMAAGDMLAAERSILLYTQERNNTGVDAAKRLFADRIMLLQKDTAELKPLATSDEERDAVAFLSRRNAEWETIAREIERLCASGDLIGASKLDAGEGTRAYHEVDVITDRLEALQLGSLGRDKEKAIHIFESSRSMSFALLGIAFLVSVWAYLMMQRIRMTLQESADKLRSSMAFSEVLMDSLPGVVCIFDSFGKPKRWNNNFLGYSSVEVIQSGVMFMVAPESQSTVQQAIRNTFDNGSDATEAWMITKTGEQIPTYLTGVRIIFENQPCILGMAVNISKQKRAEEFSRLQSAALESASDAIVLTDAEGTIQWVNPAFTRLTGYRPDEAIGRNPRILKSGKQDNAFYQTLWNTILMGRLWAGEITNVRKDGKLYEEEMHIAPVRSLTGGITNYVAVKHDITERKKIEAEVIKAKEVAELANRDLKEANKKITELSRTDPLTGLANRRTLDEALLREAARAKRLGESLSMIMGDLDHFKLINDEFGHLVGDQVLVGVAAVFACQARPYDLVVRFGGEEFIVLLPGTSLRDAMAVAERIRQNVAAMEIATCPKSVTVSLGVCNWQLGESAESFIARADAALYQAKRSGRNRIETESQVKVVH